jgi:murein DD-endopeptidase MepM/ murein hydrolase activator NlpD
MHTHTPALFLSLSLCQACTLFEKAPETVEPYESCAIAILVQGAAVLDLREEGGPDRWVGWEEHHVYQPSEEGELFAYGFTDTFELVGGVTAPAQDPSEANTLALLLTSSFVGTTSTADIIEPEPGEVRYTLDRGGRTLVTTRGEDAEGEDEVHSMEVTQLTESSREDGVVLYLGYTETYYENEDGSLCDGSDSLDRDGDSAAEGSPVDGFDYPVNGGYATQGSDGDGYYNALDWTDSWDGHEGHCGEDWNDEGGGSSDYGAPVLAIAHGWVTSAMNQGSGWGDVVTIEHWVPGESDYLEVMVSQYAHLSAVYVSDGQWVTRGTQIGEIGDADGAWASHLHFELRWDESMSAGSGGYGCFDENTGTVEPSNFIDAHRRWDVE